jgi:DNA-binding winged helix-turn-helix (wHTH) protein
MDPSAISEQIDRILRSRSFASKSQLRKLLEILQKNIDTQTSLKPGGVIQELWPEEIRTKSSADVATEMNRLRHALETY